MALEQLKKEKLIDQHNHKVDAASLFAEDTVIGLYFSAHWCPPCRGFTPKLVTFSADVLKKGHKFHIVFVSSDQSEDDFKEYFKTMGDSWKALPFVSKETKNALSKEYEISGIPTLVLVDGATGQQITKDGRGIAAGDNFNFPWKK